MMLTLLPVLIVLAQPVGSSLRPAPNYVEGQPPMPGPAIDAAKKARADTEAAQNKNSEALAPPPAATSPQGQPAAPQAPAQGQPPAQPSASASAGQAQQQPPTGQGGTTVQGGYTYDPEGRRDPFVSLLYRGGDLRPAGAQRPPGLPGLLISEVAVKGVLKSTSGSYIALLQAPDNKTYVVRQGDRLMDGSVKSVASDAVVFSQDVNDPLSLVKQREVRKTIRPETR